MKKILFLICLSFLLISCNNDETSESAPISTVIEGSWSLVSVSGGLAPSINLNPSWVTYHFGQNLTVINNNPSQTIQSDGLQTGSYSYSFNENTSACQMANFHKLSISNFISNLCVKIEGDEMTIDTGIEVDGLLYKFVRTNCLTNQECVSLEHALVETITVPSTGNVNQPISIPIGFTVSNGCGNFGYISETNSGSIKTLKVFARYIGCICTQALMPIQTNYVFTPTTTGNQTIRIEQPDGSFLTYTIIIQ